MPPGIALRDFAAILPEIVLTVAALAVLVADVALFRRTGAPAARRSHWLAWMALAGLSATAATLVPLANAQYEVANGLLAVDRVALFFKVIFLAAAALTVLMSVGYLDVEGVRAGEYYFLVLCATLGMMVMAGAIDLVTAFIGLETMAVSFYVLAGFIRPSPRSNEAAVKYFLLGAFSLAILLYGMSVLYGETGTTGLRVMAATLAGQPTRPLLTVAVLLVAAGLSFKIAAVPFHMWAPDVYEGAPTPIAAFLSVGSKAAAFALLLRIFVEGVPMFVADWRPLFWVLAVVTMTAGNVAALTQGNVKRMLAYSSIAHVGYLLIGPATATTRGVTAMLVYLVVYAGMQLGAFAVVVLLHRRDVAGEDVADFGGLARRRPLAAFAMLVFLLSLAGIPPTAGFMGKLWLFGAAVEHGAYALAVCGVLNSVLSVGYYGRVIAQMYGKAETTGSEPVAGPALTLALAVALVATLAFGLYPRALFTYAEVSARALGGPADGAAPR